jgi:hypothetical protein
VAEFPDLSPYCYQDRYFRNGTLNVGWLDLTKPFRTAEPTQQFLETLLQFATVSVAVMRGAHFFELCGPEKQMDGTECGDDKLFLGMAEIRVFASNGTIYAAPNLIYHYVKDHSYAPPDTFIEAVLTTPSPPHDDFYSALEKHQLEWWDTYHADNRRLARRGVRYKFGVGLGYVPDV